MDINDLLELSKYYLTRLANWPTKSWTEGIWKFKETYTVLHKPYDFKDYARNAAIDILEKSRNIKSKEGINDLTILKLKDAFKTLENLGNIFPSAHRLDYYYFSDVSIDVAKKALETIF